MTKNIAKTCEYSWQQNVRFDQETTRIEQQSYQLDKLMQVAQIKNQTEKKTSTNNLWMCNL